MRWNSCLILPLLAVPAYGNKQCDNRLGNGGACIWAAGYRKDDCYSFLLATITPCPSTSTVTKTTTITNPPATSTVTSSVTSTNTVTNTATTTLISTSDVTLTTTSPVTDVTTGFTETTTSTTITITLTATPTTIVTQKMKMRRAVSTDVRARGADTGLKSSSCTTLTSYPTHLPWYAWVCNGPSQYSSACSCVGVTTHTKTLSPVTTTVTTTSTVQSTPTVTATETITNINSATVTQTVTSMTTLTTTDATDFIPATTIESTSATSTITATATVTVSPLACYNFVASSGQFVGQYIVAGQPPPNEVGTGYLLVESSPAYGPIWSLRSDGRIYGNNIYGWASSTRSVDVIYDITDGNEAGYSVLPMYCTIDPSLPTGGITGAVGGLSCNVGGGDPVGFASEGGGLNVHQYSGDIPNGYTAENFVAVPTSC